jgi:hypothetical protein
MPLGPNAGYKLFNTGDVLTSTQVQNNLQNQTVMFFASAAVRDASAPLTAALTEGMFCYLADTNTTAYYTGSAWVPLFQNQVLISPKEQAAISATAANTTVNVDVSTASVQIYTANAAGNYALNVRGSSSVTLDSLMAVNDSITVTFEHPNGATAYYPTSVTVDGSAPASIKWLGGSAPSSGNINSTDVYMIQIRKTAASTFTVIASQSKFA